jgi:drug/metabolite transporter (DMT)-like permease
VRTPASERLSTVVNHRPNRHGYDRAVSAMRVPVALPPGLGAIALGSVLFGSSGVLILLSYDHGANAAGVLVIRALATLPWLLVLLRQVHRSATREHVGGLVAMAVLVTIGVASYSLAIARMSPAFVALIYYCYPVLVIIGARMFGWIRLDALTTLAAAAALGGVALTVGAPAGDMGAAGVTLSLISGLSYAGYLLVAERTLRRVSPLAAMAVVGGLTSLLLLVGSLVAGPHLPSDGRGIAIIALLFACLVFPHALLLRGVGQIGGTWGALISSLEVVVSVTATAAVVGVPFNPSLLIGGALILLGGLAAPIVASRRTQAPSLPEPHAAPKLCP